MAKERRINIRVSPEEFDQLDKKRFEERRSFQEIGIGLFRAWIQGDLKPDPGTEPDPDVEKLIEFKRIGDPDRVEILRGNIEVFLDNARRALNAPRKRKGT